MAHKLPCEIALANQLYLLRNEFQSRQTTFGRFCAPSISYPNNLQPALNSNTTTSAHSFPFLSDTVLVPPVSSLSASNPVSVHGIMTNDSANNNSTQEIDNIFDVNVLHERLFGVSSVAATALPQEAPQQWYSLANSGTSSASFLQSLEDSAAAGFDQSNFNVYPSVSGTYENPDQLIGRDPQNGNYWNNPVPVNENFFGTGLEDKATQKSGPSGFGVDDQINQLVSSDGFGGDANFPVLQNNFHLSWENWRN